MKLITTLALFLSFSAFAQVDSLVKTFDGSTVRCQSKADVFSQRFSSVYRPVELKRSKGEAFIRIEFLRCVQKNNSFAFIRDHGISTERVVSDEFTQGREIAIKKKDISLLAINEKSELVDRQLLTANDDGTYSAVIKTTSKVLDISVQSLFEIYDVNTLEQLDRGIEALGSFRLFSK